MGSARRAISLVLALSLTVIGVGCLAYLLLKAPWWKGWMVLAAGFAGFVGMIWLYDDFRASAGHRAGQKGASGARRIEWDTDAATMEAIRQSIRPILTELPLRQALAEDFPRECRDLPVAGGWGYAQSDAIVFRRDDFPSDRAARDFASLEYMIAQKIIYEELIIFQPKGAQYSGIDMELVSQALRSSEDSRRHYDILQFRISCWSDQHWEALRQEWEENEFGTKPGFSRERHDQKRSASRIQYEHTFWFDITEVFGTDV
jgi:hypothetical protein